jgi:hypothetical protein
MGFQGLTGFVNFKVFAEYVHEKGPARISKDMYGFVRICQDSKGFLRICEDLQRSVRICIDLQGFTNIW